MQKLPIQKSILCDFFINLFAKQLNDTFILFLKEELLSNTILL